MKQVEEEYDPFAGVEDDDMMPLFLTDDDAKTVNREATDAMALAEQKARAAAKARAQEVIDNTTLKQVLVNGVTEQCQALVTPVSQLQAMRRYRNKNTELVRKSSDRSAAKRYIKKATRKELQELSNLIEIAIANLAQ